MVNVSIMVCNPFQVNVFIISDNEKNCIIFDPAFYTDKEKKSLLNYISKNQLNLVAVYCTHGHIDHLLGANFITRNFGLPVFVHKNDQFLVENCSFYADMFGLSLNGIPEIEYFSTDKKQLSLGKNIFSMLHVPGHSPGSVAYLLPKLNYLFCGDVLFRNSIGRTDLPGGNYEELINSIQNNFLTLPDETIVFPGHNEKTTIDNEKTTNPFLKNN